MHRIFEWFYGHFGRVTKEGFRAFVFKRLPFYLLGLMILLIGGVKAFMMTFLFVFTFTAGWWMNKAINAFKDYRLTLRLNKMHFTSIEYDAMRRERDLALEALKTMTDDRAQRGRAAPMPPRPAAPVQQQRFGPDEIREFIAQAQASGELDV
jgi:hypothetical protein